MVSNATQRTNCTVFRYFRENDHQTKKAHPKFNDAFQYGDEVLKHKLLDAMFIKRAIGFEYEEDTNSQLKKQRQELRNVITKYKKQSLPDVQA